MAQCWQSWRQHADAMQGFDGRKRVARPGNRCPAEIQGVTPCVEHDFDYIRIDQVSRIADAAGGSGNGRIAMRGEIPGVIKASW